MTPSAIGRGYQVVLEDQTDRRRDSMHYDRVVLCQGVSRICATHFRKRIRLIFARSCFSRQPFNNPRIPECLFAKPFHGPIVHSYHLHSKMHERVLEAGPRVVVVGLGKSSIDIAALYTQLGKRVTIVFDRAKFFNAPSKEADHRMTTRRIATMFPAEQLTTWVEWLLHKTRLGAWWLRRSLREGSERQRRALGIDERSPLYRNDIDIIWRGPDVNGGRSSGLPNNFHQLVRDGRIDCKPGCRPAEITDDGRGVILTDGSRVDADAIVCGTGFKSSFDFIREQHLFSYEKSSTIDFILRIALEHRIQLGIEPVAPDPRLDAQRRHRLDGYLSLRDPPAAPTSGKASHVYKGLIPVGAFDRRDLACNGFFHLLGSPFTGEIAAHWILDFFLEDPSLALRLPADQGGAWDAAESHANWVRARYQARDTSFETNKVLPLHNHHQYNDGLLSDMRLSTAREAKPRGWFGWGYYTQPVKPSSINNLREERMERDRRRRQRRENDGSRTMFDWLSEWLRGDL